VEKSEKSGNIIIKKGTGNREQGIGKSPFTMKEFPVKNGKKVRGRRKKEDLYLIPFTSYLY
jgi:hypothetical protein